MSRGYSEIVKEFAEPVSKEFDGLPQHPQKMDSERIKFMRDMVISELNELNEAENVVDQADAMVDLIYYVAHCAWKQGIDLDPIFEMVHKANMRKLVDGKPIIGANGKVLKPQGWYGPEAEIEAHFKSLK
jgi:predicted HAD superfamily Cof-like phosphohydrolase